MLMVARNNIYFVKIQNTTEVYFGISAAIFAGTGLIFFLLAMFGPRGKYDRAKLFPYWALSFLCAFKGLLLLGVSGVPSTSKDVAGEMVCNIFLINSQHC